MSDPTPDDDPVVARRCRDCETRYDGNAESSCPLCGCDSNPLDDETFESDRDRLEREGAELEAKVAALTGDTPGSRWRIGTNSSGDLHVSIRRTPDGPWVHMLSVIDDSPEEAPKDPTLVFECEGGEGDSLSIRLPNLDVRDTESLKRSILEDLG